MGLEWAWRPGRRRLRLHRVLTVVESAYYAGHQRVEQPCDRHLVDLGLVSGTPASWSIKKFVRTACRYPTVDIQAGDRTFTAADPTDATSAKPSTASKRKASCTLPSPESGRAGRQIVAGRRDMAQDRSSTTPERMALSATFPSPCHIAGAMWRPPV